MKGGKRSLLVAILCLAPFGCMHYVKGDLAYIKPPVEGERKTQGKEIEYRVNVQYYGIKNTWRSTHSYRNYLHVDENGKIIYTRDDKSKEKPLKEREIVNKLVKSFIKDNEFKFRDVFKLRPEEVFLDISLAIHSTQTHDSECLSQMAWGGTLYIYPAQYDAYNIYYAIDVYDKRMLKKVLSVLNAKKAESKVWDASGKKYHEVITLQNIMLDGLQPIGSYEYTRVIVSRIAPVTWCFPVSLPVVFIFDGDRSLSKAVADMNGEFLEDLNTNQYNQIISHSLARDGKPGLGGLIMTQEQIGEDSTSVMMATLAAGNMMMGSLSKHAGQGRSLDGALKAMGREMAIEAVKAIAMNYVKSEINERLTDEQKNLYITLVRDTKQNKWLFRGAAKSLGDLPGIKGATKKTPIKTARKFFENPFQMNQWIKKQEKWTGK